MASDIRKNCSIVSATQITEAASLPCKTAKSLVKHPLPDMRCCIYLAAGILIHYDIVRQANSAPIPATWAFQRGVSPCRHVGNLTDQSVGQVQAFQPERLHFPLHMGVRMPKPLFRQGGSVLKPEFQLDHSRCRTLDLNFRPNRSSAMA